MKVAIVIFGVVSCMILETMATINGSVTSLKHQEILQQFRKYAESVTTERFSDEFLLRRLRAKYFDLRKAEKLFLFGVNVRQTYQMDTIADTYVKTEMLDKHEFSSFMGFDKDGAPIQYISLGNADLYGFLRAESTFDICIYCCYCVESLIKFQKKRDKETGRHGESTISAIFDMENFSLPQLASRAVIETGLDLMRMFQDEQPGILNHAFVINAPVYFAAIFNIFKPILKMDLLERLVVSSKESSASDLLKYIDADELPAFLGGRKVDVNGDPKCSSLLKFGRKIPEEYYKKNQPMMQLTDPDVIEMIVPARVTKDVFIPVEEAGSRLQIELRSDNTIGLRILFRRHNETNNKSEENYPPGLHLTEELVSPYAKIQSHLTAVDSTVYCARAGIYIFRFDNTFSWMASKQVIYRIRLLPPTIL